LQADMISPIIFSVVGRIYSGGNALPRLWKDGNRTASLMLPPAVAISL